MNEYYVYVYLDPTKPGRYQYDNLDFCFLYEPFYIGKGKNYRAKKGLNEKSFNKYKINKISSLRSRGLEIIVDKLVTNITEVESLDIERSYINKIGKFTNGGPLVNIEDGGQLSNLSDLSKLKMSENHADVSGSKNPMFNKHHSDDTKNLIRSKKITKKILQYDIDGNFIREWDGYYQIKINLGLAKSNISRCCLLKPNVKSIGGFIWRHKNSEEIPIKIEISLPSKKIYQLSNGLVIKEWESIANASRHYNNYHISDCCRGVRKMAAGYTWKFKDDYDKERTS